MNIAIRRQRKRITAHVKPASPIVRVSTSREKNLESVQHAAKTRFAKAVRFGVETAFRSKRSNGHQGKGIFYLSESASFVANHQTKKLTSCVQSIGQHGIIDTNKQGDKRGNAIISLFD